jgi:hypothetical protein
MLGSLSRAVHQGCAVRSSRCSMRCCGCDCGVCRCGCGEEGGVVSGIVVVVVPG